MPPELDELAREGRLYTSLILYGGTREDRLGRALGLARALLCERGSEHVEGCDCRHCRRIVEPGTSDDLFHPDLHFLEKDLLTVTSAEATRRLLRAAQMSPFEARGQVFVVTSAETLSDEGANVLLKILEEPPTSAPRNFFLLCPGADQLLPTLRSRSMCVYLGAESMPDEHEVQERGRSFATEVAAWTDTRSTAYLLTAAAVLGSGGGAEPRDTGPWRLASAAVLEAYRANPWEPATAEALLDLAAELQLAVDMRARGIGEERILEGLVSRHLGAV
jgi:hypothetical protein